ncbi:MAG TPA: hypothetical protein VLL27_01420 [Solirubrobacterales bacterium]|nr:hypothetical protein [Solirubrobacterales bacterium]
MPGVTRVLVVVAGKTVDGEKLSAELDHESEIEIKVIAPALTAARLTETAAAESGEVDPLLVIEDALASFDADQIVLVPDPSESPTWAEQGLLEEARERFPVPIRELA